MMDSTSHNIIDIFSYNLTGFTTYGASTHLQRICYGLYLLSYKRYKPGTDIHDKVRHFSNSAFSGVQCTNVSVNLVIFNKLKINWQVLHNLKKVELSKCLTLFMCILFHTNTILDTTQEQYVKSNDISSFRPICFKYLFINRILTLMGVVPITLLLQVFPIASCPAYFMLEP